jgi:hypothetical protein
MNQRDTGQSQCAHNLPQKRSFLHAPLRQYESYVGQRHGRRNRWKTKFGATIQQDFARSDTGLHRFRQAQGLHEGIRRHFRASLPEQKPITRQLLNLHHAEGHAKARYTINSIHIRH